MDETHPRAINYLGVRRLVRCAERAGARRFVRVTGMSVGYPAFDWIAVLLNVVLSMTIKWQAAGERAIRDACAGSKTMTYCVVRPGSLSDDARCAEDATGKKRVVLEAEARVHAGRFRARTLRMSSSRRFDDPSARMRLFARRERRRRAEACARNSLGIQRADALAHGGVGEDGQRGEKFSRRVHVDRRREGRRRTQGKPHRRYVAAFLAFLAGVFVLLVNGLVTLARSFL